MTIWWKHSQVQLCMLRVWFPCVCPHFVEVRTLTEYVDCFACFGCCQVYVSVVSECVVKCES